jgi:hypothetical protein
LIHEHHFTPDEANSALPRIEPLLTELRESRDRLTDADVREALSDASPGNGGGEPGRQVGEAFLRFRNLLIELQQSGIVLRDLDHGLIDFPSIREGREVYLCWQLGEERVTHWHELEGGFRGRRPLD